MCLHVLQAAIRDPEPGSLKTYEETCTKQLMNIVEMVRGQLTKLQRATLGALVVMDVHARDVVTGLVEAEVTQVADFSWQCQLRGYWEEGTVMMRIMNAEVCMLPSIAKLRVLSATSFDSWFRK